MSFQISRHACPIGTLLLVFDGETLLGLEFDEDPARLYRLIRRFHGNKPMVPTAPPRMFAAALDAYFDGDLAAINTIPIQTGGTALQRQVWAALLSIPAGTRQT